ncbi:Oidioi.mRNA.OKI2018_I69.chr1.g3796.t1.cds [Oikopleura dioica]|uniref:Oidioi.mRNA.OKI2018_I69.chr1.g3796.t1.cds n=1 Tax=Oikopleura dioica TaxID=34765 RepID=A0ABN7SZJ2_OIKDI|nr:Oidioi.mRNA.OKI2018_I69.chr1.g3796.t1.cds [Oikopleura dioica]
MSKLAEKIPPIGALVFGLISLIICATAAGTKNTLFIPLVVCLVLGCIVAAAALFVYFRQQRRQADLADDSNFFETYGYLILTIGTAVFYLIGLILFIVTKIKGGLSLGDTYKTEHIELDKLLTDLGIGTCDSLSPTHSYCNGHKQQCQEFFLKCIEKSEVAHAEAWVSLVFAIFAFVFAMLSVFCAFRARKNEEEYGTYQPTTAPRGGNTTINSDYVPGDNRMQSPLV